MKRSFIVLILLFPFLLCAQQNIVNSWDGTGLTPNSHIRTLNIYVNVIYDVHPDADNLFSNTTYWAPVTDPSKEGVNVKGTIPVYLLSLFDTAYVIGNTHGCVTRVYGESSFDALQISGDNVVVNVRESRVMADPTRPASRCYNSPFCYNKIKKVAVDVINETGGLRTIYGHDSLSDYTLSGGNKIYYTNVLIRNITQSYGGVNSGSGFNGEAIQGLRIGDGRHSSQKGTLQCVGDGDISTNPTSILAHEISHSLFGGNDYHTSGGNHRGSTETMPFMNIQGGYGLMGGANSGLVSCNGYERWRMHWKHPDAPANTYIYAHNTLNDSYLNSDIQKDDGEKWFVLRDFVTYGDAIRIKLPYKDSSITPNQYIWLEFHDVGHNNKLDFLQYSNTSCLHPGTAGVYAYYQIGRDVLESSVRNQVWDNYNRDNLRVISNEGYWDYTRHVMPRDTNFVCTQWNWVEDYFVPEFSNAFCGYQDQEKFIVPKDHDTDLGNTVDSVFVNGHFSQMKNVIREYTMWNKISTDGNPVRNSISFIGDSRDAFSTHRKINMGTNPSTCNAKTCYTTSDGSQNHLIFSRNAQYNNTATYLTGLSIEMIPLSNETGWLVKIRWDDYDITDDARWTGKIVLKGAEQVNLTRGHSITLAQNRTPAQQYRDSESDYFAEPTRLVCESGSVFTQQSRTSVILTEKSRFVLDSGASYHLGDRARILVKSGSEFCIQRSADFVGGAGSTIIVGRRGTLSVDDIEKLRQKTRIIVRPGGQLVTNDDTSAPASNSEGKTF